jgi:PadR family transcriptional regulator, regulatory protein PadR
MNKKLIIQDDLLGTIEHLVMRAVASLGKDTAYGMAIFDAVRSVYPPISFGSIYTSLDRLTWKGYLESELGEPESKRGGRARKYYQITGHGKKVLDATSRALTARMAVSTAQASR